MSIRVKTLRAHYYGRDVKQVGEVYDGAEPTVYQLISANKVERSDEPLTDSRAGTAKAPKPAPKSARVSDKDETESD